jgi:hypothetical protein
MIRDNEVEGTRMVKKEEEVRRGGGKRKEEGGRDTLNSFSSSLVANLGNGIKVKITKIPDAIF